MNSTSQDLPDLSESHRIFQDFSSSQRFSEVLSGSPRVSQDPLWEHLVPPRRMRNSEKNFKEQIESLEAEHLSHFSLTELKILQF